MSTTTNGSTQEWRSRQFPCRCRQTKRGHPYRCLLRSLLRSYINQLVYHLVRGGSIIETSWPSRSKHLVPLVQLYYTPSSNKHYVSNLLERQQRSGGIEEQSIILRFKQPVDVLIRERETTAGYSCLPVPVSRLDRVAFLREFGGGLRQTEAKSKV